MADAESAAGEVQVPAAPERELEGGFVDELHEPPFDDPKHRAQTAQKLAPLFAAILAGALLLHYICFMVLAIIERNEAIVERVRAKGEAAVLLKSGRPVARIVPVAPSGDVLDDLITFLRRWRADHPDPDEEFQDVVQESRQWRGACLTHLSGVNGGGNSS